jgi:nucleotide-binding universal stress UspA family protein
MYKSILAAIDGSDHSLTAATRAGILARQNEGELVLLHVAPNQPVPETLRRYAQAEHLDQTNRDMWDSVSGELLHRAKEHVEETVAHMPHIRVESRHGDIVEAILEMANEVSADVIVVGSRGLNRLSGMVLGSVSQKLAAAETPTDVLIVK